MSVDINISNYEEFLLSYIDGELNNEERAAVASFLQQHPAQAKELELLKAAILQPDKSVAFADKEMLYRSTVITTENYETYFLSYIDGELNAAEQTALEAFLKKHPHLQQELDTWQATRLPSDEALQFDNKEMLYRHTDTLTPENYETYLLSYIDGELSAAEEQTLHAFLQQHPALQETLQLFRRTRLQADPALRMPDKAALYRNSEPRRTIRPAWWWGAAAAVVAGCLVWLLPLRRDNVNTTPIAANGNKAPVNTQQLQKAAQPARERPVAKAPLNEQRVAETPALAANTPAANTAAKPALKNAVPAGNKTLQPAAGKENAAANTTGNSNSTTVLAQLPQPRATSEEVVQQHMEKTVQAAMPPVQEVTAAVADQNPVLASNMKVQHTPAPEPPPATAVQGELIMSVTSTSESRLLNGVASVAKFFSKKKRQKSE